ncbi:hypothetical protein BJY01DRAFT_251078 [Aspergillus pseudoustus]|uniref:Uncharacterized protein n=1 Tax=Aspergillus pseudoustus TaxID=1810923 RepID=A0ABR4JDX9_9EURO
MALGLVVHSSSLETQLLDRFYHDQPPNPVYFSDDWIHALSAMLSDVKSAALDPLDPPLGFNDVYLTWPDALYGTRQIHAPRFSLACHLAGLKSIKYTGNIVSKATLELEGVDFFPEEVDPTAPTTILAESPVHGAERAQHDDSAKYLAEVQELFEDVIGDEVVDYVILLGSHSDDSKLLNALKATVAHGLLPEAGLQVDTDRLVFLGARAAAGIAQVGMESNFEHCWQPTWWHTR